jgi:predicted tellurium resistance membrane protein TerC
MMRISMGIMLAALAVVFLGQLHGYAGSIILGIVAVYFDFFWQWLRLKLVRSQQTKVIVLGVFGGLILRIAGVFLFVWIGRAWFENPFFYVFVGFFFTIPIWSIISYLKIKQ